jgi:O-antigen ligase
MILTKNDRIDTYFVQQPLNIRFLLILTVSIFMPIYITIPVVIAVGIFMLKDNGMRTALLDTPHSLLYVFMGFLLLTIPLIYNNFTGFFTGILVVVFFILEFTISSVMTGKLFDYICKIACAMSLFCAVVAIAEKVFGIQLRVDALSGNANYYAYMIELMVIICCYQFFTTKKYIYLIILSANLAALILTGCRSAWFAMLAGLFVFALIKKHWKLLIVLAGVSLAITGAILLCPDLLPRYDNLDFSLTDRLIIWKNALGDFFAHPIFGRGLFAYAQISGSVIQPHAHNIFIDCLESTGLVGTAIAVIFLRSVIKDLVDSWKSGSEQIRASVALCGGLIAATFAHGLTDAPIMGAQTGLLFIIVLSLRPRVGNETLPAKETFRKQYRVLETVSEPLKIKMFRFMEFRKKMQSPMSEKDVESTLLELQKLSPDESEQIAILNQSIMQGYEDVFAVKEHANRPAAQRSHIR